MKIAHYSLTMLLAVPLVCAATGARSVQATQPQDSLAAAARRAREEHKHQPKAAKVWDNDNLPKSGDRDVIGSTAKPGRASTEASAASAKEPAAKETSQAFRKKQRAALEEQLKTAKARLKQAETDLNFAQRKYALDQQSFYQNPNYASDDAGAAALQDERHQIDAHKQAVQSAKDQVADLEAKLASAGDHRGDSEEPSNK